MADVFELKIISPDSMFFEGEADFLEFTSVEGGMGVYKNHIPLTTILEPCVMSIHNGTEVKKAAILGGFLRFFKTKLLFLLKMHNGQKKLMWNEQKKQRNVRKNALVTMDQIWT